MARGPTEHPRVVFATAVISALLAGTLVWLYLRGREGARLAELNAARGEQERLGTELAAARADSARLTAFNTQLQSDLAAERASFAARLTAEQQRLADGRR